MTGMSKGLGLSKKDALAQKVQCFMNGSSAVDDDPALLGMAPNKNHAHGVIGGDGQPCAQLAAL